MLKRIFTGALAALVLFCLPAFADGFNASWRGGAGTCNGELSGPNTILEYCAKRDGANDLVDVSGSNLLVYSEEFDNGSGWSETRLTATANQAKNPLDGEWTAELISEDGTAAQNHTVSQTAVTTVSGSIYTVSIYARAVNRDWIALFVATDSVGKYCNMKTGAEGNDLGTVLYSGVERVDSEWIRCWMSWESTTSAGQTVQVYVGEANADVTFDGLSQASMYTYGAQVAQRRSAAESNNPGRYLKTVADNKPVLDLADTNGPTNEMIGLVLASGNRQTVQTFVGVSSQDFSHAHDNTVNVNDTDHTYTALVRFDPAATASEMIYSHGGFQANGMYFYGQITTGQWLANYQKSGAGINVVYSPGVDIDDGYWHVVQEIRRDDIAVLCVDGACGTPVNVATYGSDGNQTIFVGRNNGGNHLDGSIAYLRLDAEAHTPWKLAWDLAYLRGVGSSLGNPGAANVIVDGTMEAAGTASWIVGSDAVLSKTTSTVHQGKQALRVTYGGTNYPFTRQPILTVGKIYKITGWYRGDGVSAFPRVQFGSVGLVNGTTNTAWQHFELVATANTTSLYFYAIVTAAGWCEFDDVYVYEYEPTIGTFSRSTVGTLETAQGLMDVAAGNPRVGDGFLIEAQVTNLEDNSDFGAGWTTVRTTVPGCTEIDPAGGATACVLHEDATAADTHYLTAPSGAWSATSGTDYVCSVFVKADLRDWVRIGMGGAGGAFNDSCYFNVASGTGASSCAGTPDSSGIEPVGNGFYRIWIGENAAATGAASSLIYVADVDGSATFNGLDQDSLHIYGFQCETGLFPTSYIATSGAAVTRTADSYTVDPYPQVGEKIFPDEWDEDGIFTFEFEAKCEWSAAADIGVQRHYFAFANCTSGNDRIESYVSAIGRVYFQLVDDDGTSISGYSAADVTDYSEWHTVKARIDFSDLSRNELWINGSSVGMTYAGNSGATSIDGTRNDNLIYWGANRCGTVTSNCQIRNPRFGAYEW